MSRHTLSKRSDSPIEVTGSSTHGQDLPQNDGSCLGKPDAPESEPKPASAPILKMPKFLQLTNEETHEKYAELMRLENERLSVKSRDPSLENKWARLDPNPVLDRYNNIHPWANNRIRLQVPEGVSDYINASPVSLVSTASKQSQLKAGVQDKYICMQGPKHETVDHTWHMLWHELSNPHNTTPGVIIMLSPTHAPDPGNPGQLMEKCFTYFPMNEDFPPLIINETNQLGEGFKAKVRFGSREPTPEGTTVEIRKLFMSVKGEDDEKLVWHFLYPSWPDFGALAEKNVDSIIQLMTLSREKNGKAENARIVHCSAGVGRTGTFVALEFLIGELHGGAWEGLDKSAPGRDPVYDTVNQLREQRRTMVQAFEQYAFLYEVLRKMWEEKYGNPCVGGDHQHRGNVSVTAIRDFAAPGHNTSGGGCGGDPPISLSVEKKKTLKKDATCVAHSIEPSSSLVKNNVCGDRD